MTASELRDAVLETVMYELGRRGMERGTTSNNRAFVEAIVEGLVQVVALPNSIEMKLAKVFDLLDMLGKQVNEHNRVLQAAHAPDHDAKYGNVVSCYCGTRHTSSVCPTCNKGAKPMQAKPTTKIDTRYWDASHTRAT